MKNFYRKDLQTYLNRFKANFLEDYPLVENFATDLIAERISEIRVISYIDRLILIRKIIRKKLNEFTKEDVKKVINHYRLLCNSGKVSD